MSATVLPLRPFGASVEDWAHFQFVLGLTVDLLPVVSNARAEIDPESKMKALGKTPSRYNAAGRVVGIANWTQYRAAPKDIATWCRQRDYGICLQTRAVRGIDVDVIDRGLAERIAATLSARGVYSAVRRRGDSCKFLVAVHAPGALTKRVLRTAHGNIELLAEGQQFVACGTHPSGARYEWEGGLPDEFPLLSLAELDALWADLEAEFAIAPGVTTQASTKVQQLTEAVAADPVAQHLIKHDWVKSRERDGRLHVRCPWEDEHTTESADSATSYFPAHTGGYASGHFHCMHAHCVDRTDIEFLHAVGLSEFDAVLDAPADEAPRLKFPAVWAEEFCEGEPPGWVIQDVLPQAAIAVLFGESGSGKTFMALDMVAAVALGTDWRGCEAQQGNVLYVCAEGVGGFKKRVKAYRQQHQLDKLPIAIIQASPNLLQASDAAEVAKTALYIGDVKIIVIDTLAQVTPGANENSGEDMGKVLAHCKRLHEATGALVLLVHHSGKDTSKGSRGWSGIKGAADAELEVTRYDDTRVLTVTKLKDGEEGAEFGFRLDTIAIGIDSKGRDITSCVVQHTEGKAAGVRRQQPKGSYQRLVMRTLKEELALRDEIQVEELIGKVVEQVVVDTGKRDRRREVTLRALNELQDAGHIQVSGTKLTLQNEQ